MNDITCRTSVVERDHRRRGRTDAAQKERQPATAEVRRFRRARRGRVAHRHDNSTSVKNAPANRHSGRRTLGPQSRRPASAEGHVMRMPRSRHPLPREPVVQSDDPLHVTVHANAGARLAGQPHRDTRRAASPPRSPRGASAASSQAARAGRSSRVGPLGNPARGRHDRSRHQPDHANGSPSQNDGSRKVQTQGSRPHRGAATNGRAQPDLDRSHALGDRLDLRRHYNRGALEGRRDGQRIEEHAMTFLFGSRAMMPAPGRMARRGSSCLALVVVASATINACSDLDPRCVAPPVRYRKL